MYGDETVVVVLAHHMPELDDVLAFYCFVSHNSFPLYINNICVQCSGDSEGRQRRHSTPRPVKSKPGPHLLEL